MRRAKGGHRTETPLPVAEHRLDDCPHAGPVLRTPGFNRFSGINAVDDDIGVRFDLPPLEEVLFHSRNLWHEFSNYENYDDPKFGIAPGNEQGTAKSCQIQQLGNWHKIC
jgi:hypothetical protein